MTGPSRGTGVLRGPANVLVAPRSAAAAWLSRRHLRPATADQRQQVTDLSTHNLYAVLHEAVLNAVLAVISSHWHSAQVCMAAAVDTAWHDGTQHLTGVRQLPERYKVSHELCVCCRLTVLHANLECRCCYLHPFAIHLRAVLRTGWIACTALATLRLYVYRVSCWISTAASMMGRPRTQARLRQCGPLPSAA